MRNLAQWARHVLDGIDHDLARHPDEELAGLRAELGGYVRVPPVTAEHGGFAVPLRLASGDGEPRLITTITTFATAADVTVAELRLEAFLPADAADPGSPRCPSAAG